MSRVNAIIDTNVLISALKSKRGASYKLLMSLVNNAFTPNISVPLFIEYESVSKRKGVIDLLSFEEIDSVLDYVLSKSQIIKVGD